MRLVAWNLLAGGGRRLPGIAAALAAHDPDVIVLSEFRASAGAVLLDALCEFGWTESVLAPLHASRNGVAVVGRVPLVPGAAPALPLPVHRERWVQAHLPEAGLDLAALYLPAMISNIDKPAFWEVLLAEAARRRNTPFLIAGDLNTGLHGIDERGATVACADAFARLLELGYVDAWRAIHGDRREYTWRSPRRRYGMRLDHAFLSPALAPRLADCRYSHAERHERLSDHSLLILDLAPPG